MNPELLLAHFGRISDAPDAVPRLRKLILNLAVRGRLVPKGSNEDSVTELLRQLESARAQTLKNGKGRAEKKQGLAGAGSMPFEVPRHWAWLELHNVGLLSGGMTPSMNHPEFWNGDINWFSPKDIKSDELLDSDMKITKLGANETGLQIYRTGCLFMVARSGILKRTFPVSINRVEATANQDLKVLMPFIEGLERYLQVMFRGMTEYILTALVKTGTTVQSLKYTEFELQKLPLPPLAEQHRIVAKVDELMALCDRLEAAQEERETQRSALVAASLNQLNQPVGAPETFRERARFYLGHLPLLTTRPEHVKQLRQTILNLAVRGRLVPQDLSDEPASELLKRISVENTRLLNTKNIRPQKPVPPSENFEAHSTIPDNWTKAYLQELAYQITDGTHLTPRYTDTGRAFLSAQNVKPFRFMPERHKLVSDVDYENYRANRKPEYGDVLLTRVGAGIGEATLLDSDFEFAFYVSLCLIKIPTRLLIPSYLVLWLNSPEGRNSSRARTYGKGASQGNLNLSLIRTFKVPLPPLAEQQRIVAKVDELMTLCERLEEQLTATQTGSRRLLEALHGQQSPEFRSLPHPAITS